jgi:hypothetical protein
VAESLGQSWAGDPAPGNVPREFAAVPSFAHLDPTTRQSIVDSLAIVTRALDGNPQHRPDATALAGIDDLRGRMGGDGGAGSSNGQVPAASPAGGSPSSAGPGAGASPAGPTARAGEVTRATLNAIDFPSFVAGLIQGTFQAIVDASIQQMEAYAELLKNVAISVDKFMADNVSEQSARDYLADQYDGVFARDTSSGDARLMVRQSEDAPETLPSFLGDLGFSSVDEIDDEAVTNVVVPAARRDMAQTRQQTLATMVMMGINRILVSDGEINAKLQFHVDASETTKIKFDQRKTTNGTISGRAGRNPFNATAIMVNTVNLNAQSDLNVRADLTGEVKVRFRSEAFPLERFADSAAIQLINQNARVPEVPAAPAAGAAPAGSQPAGAPGSAPPPAPGQPTPPVPAAPPAAPAPAAPAAPPVGAPAAQALGVDPWRRQ